MLLPLRSGHFADVDQAFNSLLQLDEGSVVGHADHASANMRAHGIAVLGVEPRVRRELLKPERYALFVAVELEDLDLNLIADVHQVAGMGQPSPGHVGN